MREAVGRQRLRAIQIKENLESVSAEPENLRGLSDNVSAFDRGLLEIKNGVSHSIMPSVRYRTVSLDEHPAPIHLLLTDVIMPRMNGAKLARTLTAMRPEMQVLFMSGYTDDTLSECGFSLESVHLVHKPFTFDQLQRKGRGVLDKRAAVYEST